MNRLALMHASLALMAAGLIGNRGEVVLDDHEYREIVVSPRRLGKTKQTGQPLPDRKTHHRPASESLKRLLANKGRK